MRRALLTPLAVAALVAAASGCRTQEQPLSASGYRGVELPVPAARPDFTLLTTAGDSFAFRRETAGQLTLLFFGYTHCPDICPLHLANIAAVLERMPAADARRVRVVFVTTDPERDTPQVIRSYLDHFDRRFIGLTGTPEMLARAQRAAGVAPARREAAPAPGGDDTEPGSYTVGHAAQVLAYTPDDLGRVVYPFGTRQGDWAHDLPRLLEAGGG